MFHNDLQTIDWKRNINEHPIDRILTEYNQMKNTKSNNYKSETKYLIQRQRVIRSFLNKSDDFEPSIRKPTTLDIAPKSLSITSIFTELNEQSTNNNRQQTTKKDIDHQSPVLTRRQRPTIEYNPPTQQVSDITNISGNQLPITIPSNFTFRNNKPSRIISSSERTSSFKNSEYITSPRIKPLNHSKSINEIFPKQKSSLSTPTWTPKFSSEQVSNSFHTLASALRAKSHLSKHFLHRQQNPPKSSSHIQDLYISPRTITNSEKKVHQTKFIIEDWDDPKSTHDVIFDEDESISADGNSSTSTCISQLTRSSSSNQQDLFSDNSNLKPQYLPIKRILPRRRTYNLALPPVTEYLDDDETTGD